MSCVTPPGSGSSASAPSASASSRVVPGAFAPAPRRRRARAALPPAGALCRPCRPKPRPNDPQQQRLRRPRRACPVDGRAARRPMAVSPCSAPPPPPPPPSMAAAPAPVDAEAGEDSRSPSPAARSPRRPRTAPARVPSPDRRVRRSALGARGHYPRPPRPQPQSGLLTAGDHDDLLNPELYASYAGHFLQRSNLRGLPRLDTRRVLTVAVQDESGRPVPFARVTLTCADGNSLSLATLADGTVVFYPGARPARKQRPGHASPGAAGPNGSQIAGAAGSQRQSVTVRSGAVPRSASSTCCWRSTRPEAWATRSTI